MFRAASRSAFSEWAHTHADLARFSLILPAEVYMPVANGMRCCSIFVSFREGGRGKIEERDVKAAWYILELGRRLWSGAPSKTARADGKTR